MTDTKDTQYKYKNKFKINIHDFKVDKELSSDSHSAVYSVQNVKTEKQYAAKVIKIEEKGEMVKKMLNYSFNNIFFCDHPTLIKYYGYSPVDFNGKKNMTLIIDLISKSPLSSFIDKAQNGISNANYMNAKHIILLGISRGMMYLNQHHILHRNLNSDNIFLDDKYHPILVNYGFANLSKLAKTDPKDLTYQEAIYMAPEVLSSNHYNLKSDVYSFGIIMYEVLTDTSPYPLYQSGKMSSLEFVQKIINEDFHPKFTTPLKGSFKRLIKRCLAKNPHDRPSFEEIFNMLAYNIEDSIFDTTDDKEKEDSDDGNYFDDSDNDEIYEYIDLITKNDIINYTNPLKSSITVLEKDNEQLRKDNEQLKDQINLLQKQNVQLAKKFDKSYVEHIVPLESRLEQVLKENKALKKAISKYIHKTDSKLEITPPEEEKAVEKPEKPHKDQDETSWDEIEEIIDSDKETPKRAKSTKVISKPNKSFSDSDDEKIPRRKSSPRISSKSDTEDHEVKSPRSSKKSARSPHRKESKTSISDDDDESKSKESVFNETDITLDHFNALPLRFQRAFINEFIKQSPDTLIKDVNLMRDVLNYLLQFNESINSIHYFSVSTNKHKESYKKATEWCQDINEVHFLSAATQILYLNNALDSSEFIEIIKQFESVSIEVKYPSENFTKVFRIVSNIKNSYISNLKIAVSISGIATSDDTFRKNKDITSVKLDSSVLYIGKNSFRDCTSLAFISIPSSVQTIEYGAFRKCYALTEIRIPSSVTTIGEGAFSKCSRLRKITIPSSVTTIGEWAFNGCSALEHIDIPNSVSQIGEWAFSSCTSLKDFTIPKSVVSINTSTFAECTSLSSIEIPSSVTTIGVKAFNKCISLKNISLPSSLTSIGEAAFNKCISLKEIAIPSKVTVIKKLTFAECSALERVKIPSSIVKIEDHAFEDCYGIAEVPIPDSVTELGFWAFPSNTVITTINKQ